MLLRTARDSTERSCACLQIYNAHLAPLSSLLRPSSLSNRCSQSLRRTIKWSPDHTVTHTPWRILQPYCYLYHARRRRQSFMAEYRLEAKTPVLPGPRPKQHDKRFPELIPHREYRRARQDSKRRRPVLRRSSLALLSQQRPARIRDRSLVRPPHP